MKRWVSIAFWSVIAAAFIGPGTVTTAAKSGAAFGPALLWALLFSTLACFVLQEAAARLTVASGLSLGQALRRRFAGGLRGWAMLILVLGAIILGCAAYEAGNILGGVAGAALAVALPKPALTLICGLAAAALLWLGAPRTVALTLSVLVALMGVVFMAAALLLRPDPWALLGGLAVPRVPEGAGLLILGLVGTTVVPYNLFLGSGLARGQNLGEMRFGLAVAVFLGGLISMAVLVVGTAVVGEFGFAGLAEVLSERLGSWAGPFFGLGLFAAGFSSAVTAPLAAALTARSLFGKGSEDPTWGDHSARFRCTWGAVLATGVAFGLAEASPIPIIVLAQALNGILLPVAAVFLLLAINDRRLVGESGLNRPWANLAGIAVTLVAVVLGLANVLRAVARGAGLEPPGESTLLLAGLVGAVLVAFPLLAALRRYR